MSASKQLSWSAGLGDKSAKTFGATTQPAAAAKPKPDWVPRCRHWRQPFELEGGLTVYASAHLDAPDVSRRSGPVGFKGKPDVGFYLDPRWADSTILASSGARLPFVRHGKRRSTVILFPWPDWGLPNDVAAFRRALGWLLRRVAQGDIVEVGCMGGHGRTGTTLAGLLVLQGVNPKNAIARVWREYCEEAVESKAQIDLVLDMRAPRRH